MNGRLTVRCDGEFRVRAAGDPDAGWFHPRVPAHEKDDDGPVACAAFRLATLQTAWWFHQRRRADRPVPDRAPRAQRPRRSPVPRRQPAGPPASSSGCRTRRHPNQRWAVTRDRSSTAGGRLTHRPSCPSLHKSPQEDAPSMPMPPGESPTGPWQEQSGPEDPRARVDETADRRPQSDSSRDRNAAAPLDPPHTASRRTRDCSSTPTTRPPSSPPPTSGRSPGSRRMAAATQDRGHRHR